MAGDWSRFDPHVEISSDPGGHLRLVDRGNHPSMEGRSLEEETCGYFFALAAAWVVVAWVVWRVLR